MYSLLTNDELWQADRIVHEAKTCGATASVALLHSLDVPYRPFFASELLALTVAHIGYVPG